MLEGLQNILPKIQEDRHSRDVTFDEDSAYNKSKKRPAEEPEETEAPRIHDTTMNEEIQEEDREFEEPQEPIDPPQEKNPHKRKPAWVREAIQGAKRIIKKEKGPGPAPGM